MMSDPRASYMSRKIHNFNGWKFAVKTGTTNDSKDGWMTGASTKYAAAVWVGYHTRRIEMSGFMENMTQPIWNGWMQGAHNGQTAKNWNKPNGVKTLPAYVVRTHVGVSSIEPSPSQDLFPGWYENKKKKSTAKKSIDIVSNKLATSCTPPRAKKTVNETSASSFSGDIFVDGGGANTSQSDDIHKCSDKKPSVNLSINDKGGGKYDLVASVSGGTHPLSSDKFHGKVIFTVGGNEISTINVSSGGNVSYKNYHANFSGAKTVTATVVDSVLYDSSDSGSITGTGGFSITQAEVSGGTTSFSWSGGSGSVTVYKKSDGSVLCSGGGGSCTASSALAPDGTQVYAKDGHGEKTSTVTVSGP